MESFEAGSQSGGEPLEAENQMGVKLFGMEDEADTEYERGACNGADCDTDIEENFG